MSFEIDDVVPDFSGKSKKYFMYAIGGVVVIGLAVLFMKGRSQEEYLVSAAYPDDMEKLNQDDIIQPTTDPATEGMDPTLFNGMMEELLSNVQYMDQANQQQFTDMYEYIDSVVQQPYYTPEEYETPISTPTIDSSSRSAIISQMANNSAKWHSASETERKALHEENLRLGASIGAKYNEDGTWNYNAGLSNINSSSSKSRSSSSSSSSSGSSRNNFSGRGKDSANETATEKANRSKLKSLGI